MEISSLDSHLLSKLDTQDCHQPHVYHDRRFDRQLRRPVLEDGHEAECLTLLGPAQ